MPWIMTEEIMPRCDVIVSVSEISDDTDIYMDDIFDAAEQRGRSNSHIHFEREVMTDFENDEPTTHQDDDNDDDDDGFHDISGLGFTVRGALHTSAVPHDCIPTPYALIIMTHIAN